MTLLEIIDGAQPMSGSMDAAVRAVYEPIAANLPNGGIVVAVTRGDSLSTYHFGTADPAKRYDVGSITKTLTGLLLAEMCGRGEVTLHDTLRSWLPAHVEVPSDDITLLHLSTHTSGLPRLPPTMFEGSENANPYAHIDIDRLYAEMAATELENPVGSTCVYSNYAVSILGHALSLAAGKPYSELVQERILTPLGMYDSGFDGSDVNSAYAGGLAVPRWTGEAFEAAGIGLSCTIDDLQTYAIAAADPMATPLAEPFNVALSKRVDIDSPAGPRSEQGLGWIRIGLLDGSHVLFHNGGTGGFRSSMVVHGPTRTAVVALCNEAEVDSALDTAGFGLIASIIRTESQGEKS